MMKLIEKYSVKKLRFKTMKFLFTSQPAFCFLDHYLSYTDKYYQLITFYIIFQLQQGR